MEKKDIIYIDRDFLVVGKPAGLPVQTARLGEMDLEHWLLGELSEREREPYLAVVHRLDQPVEGLLVFARNRKAAACLTEQSRKREMQKEYLAVTREPPAVREGKLTDFLKRDGRTNTSRAVPPGTPGAKRAELEYQCLQTLENGRTLVRVRLLTGRHHQIRVQLARAGMPIAGDRKYGTAGPGEGYPALCAWFLSFTHPTAGKRLKFRYLPRGTYFQDFNCGDFIKD